MGKVTHHTRSWIAQEGLQRQVLRDRCYGFSDSRRDLPSVREGDRPGGKGFRTVPGATLISLPASIVVPICIDKSSLGHH